jgi:hypothetical protein
MTDTTNQQVAIRLMPDWGIGPFWVSVDGGIFDPYDTEDIADVAALSRELLSDIAAWDDRFQATLNEGDPANSDFPTPQDEETFVADGRELAQRIRAELPAEIVVEYATLGGTRWRIDHRATG